MGESMAWRYQERINELKALLIEARYVLREGLEPYTDDKAGKALNDRTVRLLTKIEQKLSGN